jgi:hypothetical protein
MDCEAGFDLEGLYTDTQVEVHNCSVLFSDTVSGAFANLRKAIISFVMSFRPSAWQKKSAPTGRIFMTLIFEEFSQICRENSSYQQNLKRITCNSHEDQCTFLIISHLILLRMRNISDKSCRKSENTHFMLHTFFPPKIVPFMG